MSDICSLHYIIGSISSIITIDLISYLIFYYISQCKNAYANRSHLFVSVSEASVLKTTKSILHGKSSCVCRCLTKFWLVYILIGIMAPGWARKGSVLTGAESGKLFTSRLRCLWSDYGQVLWKTQDVVSAGVFMFLCIFNVAILINSRYTCWAFLPHRTNWNAFSL